MGEFKGTKGKWSICKRYGTVIDQNCLGIAQEHGIHNTEQWEHNAKLIASAPELLQMLETISQLQKDTYGNGSNLHMAMIGIGKQIDKLILKATE